MSYEREMINRSVSSLDFSVSSPYPPGSRAVGTIPPPGGFIQITQSILTQDRDSGYNSHNRCVFDQNNCELRNMYNNYRCFNLFASFALTAGLRTRRWTGNCACLQESCASAGSPCFQPILVSRVHDTRVGMSNRDSEFGETYGLTNHKISDGQDWTLDDTIRRGFIRKVYGILSAQLMLTFGKNTRAISSAFGFRFWSSFVTGRQADRQTGRQTDRAADQSPPRA